MRDQILRYSFLVFILFVFNRCSWIEHFVIINKTDQSVFISYELVESTSSFPIFYNDPAIHHLTSSNAIDWNGNANIIHSDSTSKTFSLELPPKSALVFGALYNDHYKNYNQYFINGRQFNLEQLRIVLAKKTISIVPKNFDEFFDKEDGSVICTIK